MMPILSGRWQTRLFLLAFVMLPVSLIFAWVRGDAQSLAPEPLIVAVTMFLIGLLLDLVYDQLQRFRWDQDWPFALFALSLALEFAAAVMIVRGDWLPGLDACRLARIDRVTRQIVCVEYALPLRMAFAQFGVVLLLSLGFVAGIGQILFVRWRFRGGAFGRFYSGDE